MNNLKPYLGEIWYVSLDPTVGHEQRNKRPCLIVSVNSFNFGPADLVVILPLTAKNKNIPWLVEVNPPEGGLKKQSFIICDQIRTVSKKRLSGKALGTISLLTLNKVKKRIKIILDLT